MGKPRTLLEELCAHGSSFGATFVEVEVKDGHELVVAGDEGSVFRIAKYPSGSRDGKELLGDLQAAKAKKKGVRTLIGGRGFVLNVTASPGEDVFHVTILPVSLLDPSSTSSPSFTAKQGQYLAFIYNYSKMYRQAPSEADLQRHFRVSPPSIHEMIKTLARNGLIETTPGQARSIRLLVAEDSIPRLK
jgi:hypothetical protein